MFEIVVNTFPNEEMGLIYKLLLNNWAYNTSVKTVSWNHEAMVFNYCNGTLHALTILSFLLSNSKLQVLKLVD